MKPNLSPAAARHYLRTLGTPMLVVVPEAGDDQVVEMRRKDLALLVYLCVEGARRHSRTGLAALLWGDSSEERSRHSLTQALSRLRQMIGADRIFLTNDTVGWRGGLGSDWEDCRDRHGFAADTPLSWPSGEFLDQFFVGQGSAEFEIWAEEKRTQHRKHVLTALDESGNAAEERGAWAEALALGQRSTQADLIFEQGHRRVMRSWMCLGERTRALQHYRQFARWLESELEVEPDPVTRALADELAQDEAAEPARPADHARTHRTPISFQPTGRTIGGSMSVFEPMSDARLENRAFNDGDTRLRPTASAKRRTRSGLTVLAGVLTVIVLTAGIWSKWQSRQGLEIAPGDGRPFFVSESAQVYMAFRGTSLSYPDRETFLACTGWQPSIAFRLTNMPGFWEGSTLPSVHDNPWIAGYALVRGESDATAYAIVGCVKTAVSDEIVARRGGSEAVLTVRSDALGRIPTGPATGKSLRPAGTVIRLAGSGEVRWILFAGGALVVPSSRTLTSHCKSTMVDVDSAEFAAYSVVGTLQESTLRCPTAHDPRWLAR